MKRINPPPGLEPNVFVSPRCNLACVFCSARGQDRVMNEREINQVLDSGFKSLSVEGGEPLLDKKLESRVKRAVRRGTGEIIVFTNGLLLTPDRIGSLLKSGVTRFNFNLPAHTPGLHDKLAGVKGKLPAKLRAIKDAIRLSPPGTVIVTFVVNALNYRALPAFVDFAAGELPGLFYLSLNLVKVKGRIKSNTVMVPRLSDAGPYLLKAFGKARAAGLRVLTDGFPLCFMKGFEHLSIAPHKFIRRDKLYASEKALAGVCGKCRVSSLCAGPRRDYLQLYGPGELRVATADARKILSAVMKSGLSF